MRRNKTQENSRKDIHQNVMILHYDSNGVTPTLKFRGIKYVTVRFLINRVMYFATVQSPIV